MIHSKSEYKIADNQFKCPICGKIKSNRGIALHIWKSHTVEGKELDNKIRKTFENGRVGTNQFIKAKSEGRIICVSKETREKIGRNWLGRKHTEEAKRKISKSLTKYLQEHPDRVPYIHNHSSKNSYPEILFEDALREHNITGWQYHYRNGIYQYDYAFPELKIDVEIDGGTHASEKVIIIDERRDKFSKENGWTILRFTAKRIKEDVILCINELENYV